MAVKKHMLFRQKCCIICGRGGTGRRVRLRGVWETVWVQVPSTAPKNLYFISMFIYFKLSIGFLSFLNKSCSFKNITAKHLPANELNPKLEQNKKSLLKKAFFYYSINAKNTTVVLSV